MSPQCVTDATRQQLGAIPNTVHPILDYARWYWSWVRSFQLQKKKGKKINQNLSKQLSRPLCAVSTADGVHLWTYRTFFSRVPNVGCSNRCSFRFFHIFGVDVRFPKCSPKKRAHTRRFPFYRQQGRAWELRRRISIKRLPWWASLRVKVFEDTKRNGLFEKNWRPRSRTRRPKHSHTIMGSTL